MQVRQLPDSVRYRSMSNAELKQAFVVDSLFAAGRIELVAADIDRAVLGTAVPTDKPLALPTPESLRASYFCERRELGIINVGPPGRVVADKRVFTVGTRECVYVGRGTREVSFEASDASAPPAFFFVS